MPVAGAYLLYSPLRRTTALLNDKAVALLKAQIGKNGEREDTPGSLQKLLQTLRQPVQAPPPDRSGALQPMFLGFLPTRSCNQSCAYCGFGASTAPQKQMDFQTATAVVDWMAEHVKALGRKTLEIHFFGGEPFVAREVVDVVIHRARAAAEQMGLIPRFEVSTNGVFDETRARFVGDYFDTVVLSFDGFRDIHDRHRGGFDTVKRTAEILSSAPAELCLRVCVSQESVSQLEPIVQWFCEVFQPSIMNVETLQPTPESEAAKLYPPDPYDFAVHYLRASRIAAGFGIETIYASAVTESVRHSFCPVGQDTLIVAPDGRISSCYLPQQEWQQRGLDLDVGHVTGGTVQIDFGAISRLRQMVMDKPRCEKCFCRWTCAGGCHVNQTYPDCSLEYNDFCIQTRIITAYSLLCQLGFEQRAETLLQDRNAMETLALHPSDRLEDWHEKDS